MTAITFEATPEQASALHRIGKETGKTTRDLLSALLNEWIEDMEDIHMAEGRLAEGNPTKPFDQVMKECGLDD